MTLLMVLVLVLVMVWTNPSRSKVASRARNSPTILEDNPRIIVRSGRMKGAKKWTSTLLLREKVCTFHTR
jgi:hypothetical protein